MRPELTYSLLLNFLKSLFQSWILCFDFDRKEREQIERIYERNDLAGKEGVRDLIRGFIAEDVEQGESMNLLLTDAKRYFSLSI